MTPSPIIPIFPFGCVSSGMFCFLSFFGWNLLGLNWDDPTNALDARQKSRDVYAELMLMYMAHDQRTGVGHAACCIVKIRAQGHGWELVKGDYILLTFPVGTIDFNELFRLLRSATCGGFGLSFVGQMIGACPPDAPPVCLE